MDEIQEYRGSLIGTPFIATIDTEGTRNDRQNCVLVVKSYQVPTGYRAYILDDAYPEEYAKNLAAYCPDASVLYRLGGAGDFCTGDVVETNDAGLLRFAFRGSSGDNILFITNRCNSNCIMCPDSEANRRRDLGNRAEYLLRLIDLLPSDTRHLTITGGEPTLLKWDLLRILNACKEKLCETEFLMLSNGRSLCVKEYRDAFLEVIPRNFRLAVPLYGTTEQEHDSITRSPGGFRQTLSALTALQHHIALEIRIVIMENNYRKLAEIADFIVKKLPAVQTVSLMGLELLGNAARNREKLWVDFEKTAEALKRTISTLLSSGIDARIYNYPLCALPRNLWGLAAKSITDHKVRYQEKCSECRVKELCGGFFFSTLHFENIPVYPVPEG